MSFMSTKDQVVQDVRNIYAQQGYAVSVRRSCTVKQEVVLACARGGTYRNRYNLDDERRRREISTKKTNCPFQVRLVFKFNQWNCNVANNTHNHEPCQGMIGNPAYRRLTSEQRQTVKTLSNAGVRPKAIATVLTNRKNGIIHMKNIYNEVSASNREMLNGRPVPLRLVFEPG
jgi:Transcription factor AFT